MSGTSGTNNTYDRLMDLAPFKTNPLAMFDITIPCEYYSTEDVLQWMREHCKRWAFQQERGDETGYLHFQCRISLHSKKRLGQMIKWIHENNSTWHVSATSNPSYYTGNEFYVMKIDTRVDGPWTDREDVDPAKFPKRLRQEPVWKPWQKSLLDKLEEEPDDRTVNLLIDKSGKQGKTLLSLYLMTRNKSVRIPVQKEAKDIMRIVMDLPKRKSYFIDLPRADNKKNQKAIYGAIEEIKNGFAYDDRYHYRSEIFEPPHMWVFTNHVPDIELLSGDRWIYWTILNNQLIRVSDPNMSFTELSYLHTGMIPSPSGPLVPLFIPPPIVRK